MSKGLVYLVGAGPGDLGLVTLRARQLLERADVVIYDYLCNPAMLAWARPEAEKIYVGKKAGQHALPQEGINALLVERAQAGQMVVRLKGGDPYVFGRGGEEAQELVAAGCGFQVVPGVTSAIAAPAYAGIPVTHRDHGSMVTFITGHEDPTKSETSLDWRQLAQLRGTKIFLMGVERLRSIAEQLLAEGADPQTPVALVRWGTQGRQQSVEGTLATIVEIVEKSGLQAPAIIVMGDVVKLRRELNWFEQRPLFGQRVVVTRTRPQASALSEQLRELGADVLEIPTIRTVPSPVTDEMRQPWAGFDWLIFTSPNGVEHFFRIFLEVHRDVRALGPVRIAVVGPATRRALSQFHLPAEKQPHEFTTEALAQTFSAQEIKGKRFCLPRSNLASPVLSDYLQAHGGILRAWTVYETQPETEDENGARAGYENEGADWILFTSASTAENWSALHLKIADGKPQPQVASIGPVTSATLRKLGYTIAVEAKEHTIPGLVEAVLRTREVRS